MTNGVQLTQNNEPVLLKQKRKQSISGHIDIYEKKMLYGGVEMKIQPLGNALYYLA